MILQERVKVEEQYGTETKTINYRWQLNAGNELFCNTATTGKDGKDR